MIITLLTSLSNISLRRLNFLISQLDALDDQVRLLTYDQTNKF